jgi:hypothetical protein
MVEMIIIEREPLALEEEVARITRRGAGAGS